MKKEYKIQQEQSGKYSITYYINNTEEITEFYSDSNGTNVVEIRIDYIKHPDSL